ncbi:MAG: tRNA (5-methylaminomethyl-2-thiouridine)(34)-methyltransferase MnmD [Bacteroidetes bacterium]|nr:tRNA (5-methylaminomethyl-2-thiouridine)(34)-methyltransferase MnmD [Bacteroidota bacterium]
MTPLQTTYGINTQHLSVIKTEEGSHTIYNADICEHYHSLHGAIQENKHVFIKNGLLPFLNKSKISILEMGFGTGLNALLTYHENSLAKKQIEYTTIEMFPLSADFATSLNYCELINPALKGVFNNMHQCNWNERVQFNNFNLHKVYADMLEIQFEDKFDLVYFDAFSPAHQPLLWSKEVFKKIADACTSHSVLVTYCAKEDIRNALQEVGFEVEILPGEKGKREMIYAKKN